MPSRPKSATNSDVSFIENRQNPNRFQVQEQDTPQRVASPHAPGSGGDSDRDAGTAPEVTDTTREPSRRWLNSARGT
jgi:hypothetical protein